VELKRNNMKKTAVHWLAEQIECFGNKHELQMSWATLEELCEQAKELEKNRMIEFHKWMIENDTVQNAEKHFHFTDSDMLNEYYNEI
jgi:hypothetical protein